MEKEKEIIKGIKESKEDKDINILKNKLLSLKTSKIVKK